MKNLIISACAAGLLFGGMLTAADKAASNASKEVNQDTKTTTNAGTNKVSTDTVYGKIESYDQNKSMSVSVPGKVSTTKSFDLSTKDETYNVASGLKVGDWVRVREMTDNNGHKTLTVDRSSEKASRAKRQ